MKKLRVLVACEESQAVCIAFRERGFEAYSCDILPCSGGHPEWHIQDDVLKHINDGWDMMIAHPPCTYLCNAGLHYSKKNKERMKMTMEAFDFFIKLYNAPIKNIAVENPVGIISTIFRKPDQIINPFQFGTSERKMTCLWLVGIPKLIPTTDLEVKPIKTIIRKTGKIGKPYNYYWRQGKTSKERSKTFQCIADAMATQWGDYLLTKDCYEKK
jgi:site-specific DNA-cytosine methylase